MSSIEKFKNPSSAHKVQKEGAGFSIMPIDNSDAALKNFQPLAREAMRGGFEGYVTKRHPDYGDIDDVFFGETNSR